MITKKNRANKETIDLVGKKVKKNTMVTFCIMKMSC